MKNIFRIFCILLITIFISSCHEIKNKELYEITDKVVESLYTTYEHYDMFGKHMEYTEDGEYHIMPIGRLINVRIEHEATDEEYEELLEELQDHYKGNPRVNQVYRCKGGTLMIDCRN